MMLRNDHLEGFPLRVSPEEKKLYLRFTAEGPELNLLTYLENELPSLKIENGVPLNLTPITQYLETEIGLWLHDEARRQGIDLTHHHRAKDALIKRMRDKTNGMVAKMIKKPGVGLSPFRK